MIVRLKCRHCGGTGVVPNEKWVICRQIESDAAKQYFQIDESDDCDECRKWIDIGCGQPEMVPCPHCQGTGIISFNDEDWELLPVEEGERKA